MVAAWINADTGVGPAMASGSHTYSGICALFPAAPRKKKSVTHVHQRVARAHHEHEHEEDEEVQVREVARIARVVPHVADAEHVDQEADPRDDHHHEQRQLVELDRRVDGERARRHPGPVAHHDRLRERRAEHAREVHERDQEREADDAGADPARERVRGRPLTPLAQLELPARAHRVGRCTAVRERERPVGEEAQERQEHDESGEEGLESAASAFGYLRRGGRAALGEQQRECGAHHFSRLKLPTSTVS
jgi:hypothetical protein